MNSMRSGIFVRGVLFAMSVAAVISGAFRCQAADDRPGVIMEMRYERSPSTVWKYFPSWQTDVARIGVSTNAGAGADAGGRTNGELVRVNAYDPREGVEIKDGVMSAGVYHVKKADTVLGSPLPPAQWMAPAFDDNGWYSGMGRIVSHYCSLAFLAARGRFEVSDPAHAPELSLNVVFQGGIVVYLNGKEVGRSALPSGPLDPYALADDYPADAFMSPKGGLLPLQWGGFDVSRPDGDGKYLMENYNKRVRTLDVKLPASLLKKGVNVLAVEVHRAPAIDTMFTTVPTRGTIEPHIRGEYWWNRVRLDQVKLTAPAGASGVTPNVEPPAGMRVWTQPAYRRIVRPRYADPAAPAPAIAFACTRNGAFPAQLTATAADGIRGLKVTASDLIGPGGATIPAAAIQARYVRWHMESPVPYELCDGLDLAPEDGVNAQSVWLTLTTPARTAPGRYRGKLSVTATGRPPIELDVQADVADWKLPEPQGFTTYIGLAESPDSVAMQYNVPMWSEEHWKLIDRVFELMAQVGNRDLYVPLIGKTHFGNEQSMVRWIKQADGSYKHDFSIMERYLDTAVKRCGKLPVVVAYAYELALALPEGRSPFTASSTDMTFTVVDAATGEAQAKVGPHWGTPEAVAFWKPVMAGFKEVLAKRGMADSMVIGMGGDFGVNSAAVNDLCVAAPGVPWALRCHNYQENVGGRHENAPGAGKIGYIATVCGAMAVFWDPGDPRPFYGWRNPYRVVAWPRDGWEDYTGVSLNTGAMWTDYRVAAEGTLFSGRTSRLFRTGRVRMENMVALGVTSFKGVRGLGGLGADFWPVLGEPGRKRMLCGRYPETAWGTVTIANAIPYLLRAGATGPISTARMELLRQSLQEAEADIFIRNALLDEGQRAKLGKDLALKCEAILDDRLRTFRYIGEFCMEGKTNDLLPVGWDTDFASRLYAAAADVRKALGVGEGQ